MQLIWQYILPYYNPLRQEMNFIGCSRLHFILVVLQCLNMAMASVSDFASCTSSSFSRSVGYILRGFLLGEFEVGDIMECKKRCIISVNCLSLNILTNSNGRFVCQLNSGLKERRPRAVCTARIWRILTAGKFATAVQKYCWRLNTKCN